MSPTPSHSNQIAQFQVLARPASGWPVPPTDEPRAGFAPVPATYAISLPAAVILASVLYVAALAGTEWFDVTASVLDGVPVCLGLLTALYIYGHLIPDRAHRVAQVAEGTLIVIALGLSLACLSYLCAMVSFPLRDQDMIWIDRHLGFDWLQTMRDLDRWPAVLSVLNLAYLTFTTQLVATAFFLVIIGRTRELDRFLVTSVCASLIAEIASILVPTLGPMSAMAGNSEFANVPTLGRTTAGIVLGLREGTLRTIDLDAIDGIISFPSMHAAVAVLVPFTLRGYRWLFWPVVVLDGLMLVSAVPSGNHYLVDVLGGIVVAGLAIACGGRIQCTFEALVKDRYRSEPGWIHANSDSPAGV